MMSGYLVKMLVGELLVKGLFPIISVFRTPSAMITEMGGVW